MIDYVNAEEFVKDSVHKDFVLTFDDSTVLNNSDIYEQKFELHESICSAKTLTFGTCESSYVKFKVTAGATQLAGKRFNLDIILNNDTTHPFRVGRYLVVKDVLSSDEKSREITAYDALYEVLNTNHADWYNGLTFPMTLKQFRNSFFQYLGIAQETTSLVNDDMTVYQTVLPSEISGKDILFCICEINGVMGKITRDNKFRYVQLKVALTSLYPRNDLFPEDDLFPREALSTNQRLTSSRYRSCDSEDIVCKQIDKLQIREKEDDIGAVVGTGTNMYVMQDNFLVYGLDPEPLAAVAQNVFDVIKDIYYTPAEITKYGDPTLETGDYVNVYLADRIIGVFILERHIKGIQTMVDEITSSGTEYHDNQVNSVNRSIEQLRGKTNELTRTVTETNSRITDVQSGLQSQITQNADNITLKVSKGNVSSEISQEADAINISSNRITINSTYFTLSADGSISATNASLSGSLQTHKSTNEYLDITGGEIKYYSGGTYKAGLKITSDGFIDLDGDIKIKGTKPVYTRDVAYVSGNTGTPKTVLTSSITSYQTIVTGVTLTGGTLTKDAQGHVTYYEKPSINVTTTNLSYISSTSSGSVTEYSSVAGYLKVENGLIVDAKY